MKEDLSKLSELELARRIIPRLEHRCRLLEEQNALQKETIALLREAAESWKRKAERVVFVFAATPGSM